MEEIPLWMWIGFGLYGLLSLICLIQWVWERIPRRDRWDVSDDARWRSVKR